MKKILIFKNSFQITNLKLKITLLVLLYTLYHILYTPSAYAAGIDLGISPPLLTITALAPAQVSSPITIQNLSDDEVTLHIALQPFKPSDKENGTITYLSSSDTFGADPLILQKIHVTEDDQEVSTITIGPQQEKLVKLTVAIGKNDPQSDYYFSVIFVSNNNNPAKGNTSQTIGGIATNVLLTVNQTQKPEGIIEEFSSPSIIEQGPVPFTLRVRNTGNTLFTTQGKILITNMFGQTIGKVDLLPVNILGQSVRAIPDSSQKSQDPQNDPKAVWNEKFLLGIYTAKLQIALSDNGPFYTRTITFFALPTQALLGILLGILLVFVIAKRMKERTH